MKKYILIPALIIIPVSFCVVFFFQNSITKAIPKPSEGEEEWRKELWYESIHRAAPGTDWRAIEKQNQINAHASLSAEASFANGLLEGDWEERGSENQAGRNIEADYDAAGNDFYAISNNAALWKKNLATGGWMVLNKAHFGRNILKVIKNANGTNRIIASLNNILAYSDDNGQTFSPSAPVMFNSPALTAINDASQTLYCVASDGLYISTNRGQSFTRFFAFTAGDGSKISLHKTHNTNEVYLLDTRFSDGVKLYSITSNTATLISTGTGIEVNSKCILRSANISGTTTWYTLINDTKIYKSINAGTTWTFQNTVPGSGTFEVSMDDPQKIFVGGLEAWRSFNGGTTWTLVNSWGEYYGNIMGKLHADIMRIAAFRKTDGSSILFINNDGGTAISTDNLLTTLNISSTTLRNSEYYDVLTDPKNPKNIFAGSQDQGFQRNTNALVIPGLLNFTQVISGDYTQLALSGNTVRHLWTQYPGANLYYYNNSEAGLSLTWTMPGSRLPNYGWTVPITNISNPEEDEVYIGGGDITGGTGSYIMKLKPSLSAPFNITPTQINFNFRAVSNTGNAGVTAIETVKGDPNRIYVATEDGTFFFTNNAGQTWTKAVFSGPTPAFLYGSSIYASRLTPNLLWYGGTGYSNSPVYKSTDGGNTFTDIKNGLPSTHIYKLVANPAETMLFAATEAGPYVYIIAEGKWYSMIGSNNPIHSYTSVQYIEPLNIVRFGTYGRGIWDFKISNLTPPTPSITVTGSASVCQGNSVTLNSSAASGNQWYKEGTSIAGAVNNSYQATQSGSYTVKVTGANGLISNASAAVIVTIFPLPAVPTITSSGSSTFCQGSKATLTSSVASSYQWYKDAVLISGASAITYDAVTAGSYTVRITDSRGCSSASSGIAVTVNPVPSKPVVSKNNLELFSSSTTGNQWFENGVIIAGAVNQIFKPTTSGLYSVRATQNGCVSEMSDNFNFLLSTNPDPNALENTIRIFPNPMIEDLTIENKHSNSIQLQLMDISGRKIAEIKKVSGNYVIPVKRLPAGFYMIVITDEKTNKRLSKLLEKKRL